MKASEVNERTCPAQYFEKRFDWDFDEYCNPRVYDNYQEFFDLSQGRENKYGLVPMSEKQIADILNYYEKSVGYLENENYGLWGELVYTDDALQMLREAIITVKHVYELKYLSSDSIEQMQINNKLEAIDDIEQQLYLIKLREGYDEEY